MIGRALPTIGARLGFTLLLTVCGLGIAAPWVAADPSLIAGEALHPPGAAHPFGTDDLGRDLFAGVVHGASTSLRVGLAAAGLSALVGLAVGGVAGLRAGSTDHLLMRLTEFVQALPRFFLVVVIVSLFGSSLTLIVLVLGLTAWPATARMFRAQVQTTLDREFVVASRAAGAVDRFILLHHVAPLALPALGAQISYQAGGAILAEAGLSFFGLGDPTVVSWGGLLGSSQHFVREAWWMSVFPGLAVTLTVLACNLLADSLVHRKEA